VKTAKAWQMIWFLEEAALLLRKESQGEVRSMMAGAFQRSPADSTELIEI
jgi:hypothetical protein